MTKLVEQAYERQLEYTLRSQPVWASVSLAEIPEVKRSRWSRFRTKTRNRVKAIRLALGERIAGEKFYDDCCC